MTEKATSSSLAASRRIPAGLWALLALCVAGLGLHIWRYAFLCDDAFISFRYARNFAQGHGLVFNPGFERVEGYSNFLWVLILAAGQWMGIAPEHAANPLLILFGVAIVVWVTHYCLRHLPDGASPYWALLPAAYLAANRSFAMWCTSGLETKLFELCLVGAVLTSLSEMQAMARGNAAGFPWSAVWLAAGALTRPDGVLYAGCIVLARIIWQVKEKTLSVRPLLIGAIAFVVPVGGQLLFRKWYYNDWLPNTYYAKVGGQSWWEMGFRYLACFFLEYTIVLWLPLIVLGVLALRDGKRLHVVILLAAAIIPHAIYVAAIGGDHFEYRVLDTYLPFLFIQMFYGACQLSRTVAGRWAAAALAIVGLAASMAIPEMTHRGYPTVYRVGFPGLMPRDNYNTELIDSSRFPWVFQTPIIGAYCVSYNDRVYLASRQFVGLRQEEHKGFLGTAMQQAKWIRELIDAGTLSADLHFATDCVGAIPYYTNLRVLDRVGLTDRTVARQSNAQGEYRVMAHDKLATDDYVRAMGVDIAALDNVHIVFPMGHPRLLFQGQYATLEPGNQAFAELSDGKILLCNAPQGIAALQARLPKLRLRKASELVALMLGNEGEAFKPVPREKQFGPPYDLTFFDQGISMYEKGYLGLTMVNFVCAIQTNPNNEMAKQNAASLGAWMDQNRGSEQPIGREFAPAIRNVETPPAAAAP
ncbi:MAG: hypothetical protein HZA51_08510 [Planctomycetes bacterium]|nr:hypothetical protein [Planctomycetota bacterium]